MGRRSVIVTALGLMVVSASAMAQDEPVAEFQQLLADRGCAVGTVDGQWGRRTTEAANALSDASGIAIDRPVTTDLIAVLAGTDARCPLSPVFKVREPGGPDGYWAAWERANNCESDRAYNASPVEQNDRIKLPSTVPENFGLQISMPTGAEVLCERGYATLPTDFPRDARENDTSYGDEFPADIHTQSLSRFLTRIFASRNEEDRAKAISDVSSYLITAADSKLLTENNIVGSRGGQVLAYASANYFNAAIVAFAAVADELSDEDRQRVYAWLAPMVERAINNRYGDALDNKSAYREVMASLWGYLTNDAALIQRGKELYRFHIRYMRPDGTFGLDASRAGSSGHYTTIHMGDLITIAALDAMAGGNLFDYEYEGRSIHDAMSFYLAFKDDPVSVNARYARTCDASMGSAEAPSDAPWRLNVYRGGEGFTAVRLYAAFNPQHENTARLKEAVPDLLSEGAIWDSHQGPLMCFLGTHNAAT